MYTTPNIPYLDTAIIVTATSSPLPSLGEWQKKIDDVAAKDKETVAQVVIDEQTKAEANAATALTAAKAAIYSAWAVGTLLLKMKDRLDFGEYEIWVTETCGMSKTTAWRYRRYANRSHVNDLDGYATLRQAMIATGALKPGSPRKACTAAVPKATATKSIPPSATRRAPAAPVKKVTKKAPSAAGKTSSAPVTTSQNTGLLPGMQETPSLATMADALITALTEMVKRRPLKSWSEKEMKLTAKTIAPIVAFHSEINKTLILDKVLKPQSHAPAPTNCRVDINSVFANSQLLPPLANSPAALPDRKLVS